MRPRQTNAPRAPASPELSCRLAAMKARGAIQARKALQRHPKGAQTASKEVEKDGKRADFQGFLHDFS